MSSSSDSDSDEEMKAADLPDAPPPANEEEGDELSKNSDEDADEDSDDDKDDKEETTNSKNSKNSKNSDDEDDDSDDEDDDSDDSDDSDDEKDQKNGDDGKEDDKEQEDSDEKASNASIYESDTCDSEHEPTEESEDFKPKEIKKARWLKHAHPTSGKCWPVQIPIPKMTFVEKVLTEWKKSNRNTLPGPKDFCKKLSIQTDEDTEVLVFELIVGKRKDDILNQQGQKGSLRSLWKEQFPKSKRDKGGLSFSAIENEEMLPVERAYLPLLQNAVENMAKRAAQCDKGHMPKAKLATWEQRLAKTRQSLQKRTESDKRMKEARAAATNKARSRKPSNKFDEEVNKKANEIVQQRNIGLTERIKALVDGGMSMAEAIDKAMEV